MLSGDASVAADDPDAAAVANPDPVGGGIDGANDMELVRHHPGVRQDVFDGSAVGPMAVDHDNLDMGFDLVRHRHQAAVNRSPAASLDEVDDVATFGVGEHGVEAESFAERALVDRQYPGWGDITIDQCGGGVVLEGLFDSVAGDTFGGGDVGDRLGASPLEQPSSEAVGDRPAPGDLGVALATGLVAVRAHVALLLPSIRLQTRSCGRGSGAHCNRDR